MSGQEREHKGLWVLASFMPFGFGTWAGFAYAARQVHVKRWNVYAALYLMMAVAGGYLAGEGEEDGFIDNLAGTLLLVPWLIGIGHSFVARADYMRRLRSGDHRQIIAAEERLKKRDEARRIVREDPRLARELGIGRPDRDPKAAAGLVDVNSAPEGAIARLPGVDDKLAAEIVRAREEIDGFASIEDLGMTLSLPGDLVEDLREWVVFVPR